MILRKRTIMFETNLELIRVGDPKRKQGLPDFTLHPFYLVPAAGCQASWCQLPAPRLAIFSRIIEPPRTAFGPLRIIAEQF